MTLNAANTIVSVYKMWPDHVALTGATVNSSTITGISQTLLADYYNGGKMVILTGKQAGRVYKVTDGTASGLTVDRGTLNDTSIGAIAATDRVAIWPYRNFPGIGSNSENPDWLLLDTMPSVAPTIAWNELYAQRSGGYPYRLEAYQEKREINFTWEITVQTGTFLPLVFGKIVDTGTTKAGGFAQVMSRAAYPGEVRILPAAYTSLAQYDYIRVDTSAEGEIRKVMNSNPSGDGYILLDRPLRRYHASGVTLTEIDTTAVYTHTFSEYYDTVYQLQPFVIKKTYNAPTTGATVTELVWCQAKGVSFKNDGNKLVASIPVIGYRYTYADGHVSGTHTTGESAAALVDTGANFLIAGIREGMTVENVTDGSSGTITAITATTITATLAGGSQNDWDVGDVYRVNIIEEPTQAGGDTLLFYNSEVSINSVVDGSIRTVDCSIDYGAEAVWFHNDENTGYASQVNYKRAKQDTKLGVRINDAKFLDLLLGGSEFDAYAKYSWDSDEYMTLTWNDSRPTEIPHSFPAGGPIDETMNLSVENMTVTVVDTTAYY
jgi:hypothetical protein